MAVSLLRRHLSGARGGGGWLAAMAALGLLTACRPPQSAPAHGAPPARVTLAPVEMRELVQWDEFSGRTAPVDFVEVRPRVSGHIEEVRFQSGQLVKKGQVLFVIDSRWHRAELDRRNADLALARVRLETAEREARRIAQLLTSRAISREEAEARESRVQEARAALQAAEAARNSVKLDMDYTEIRSPIDGRVSRALVTQGNYVSGVPGMTSLLTTIVSVDPIHVYVDMDENSLLKFNALVRRGEIELDNAGRVPAELQLGDDGHFKVRGFVESLDNRLDPQTGSIVLRATFPNTNGHILPGLFARIRVPGSRRAPTLLIDDAAIGTDQAQKFVLGVTSSNTVAYRQVRLGGVVDGRRVVLSGLTAGEKVIVNGAARVRPGMPVVSEDRAPDAPRL